MKTNQDIRNQTATKEIHYQLYNKNMGSIEELMQEWSISESELK